MLTQAMAKAFAPEVRVNCVAPGFIELDDSPIESAADAGRFASRTPLRRNGSADDVAQAVLYFAVSAPFITGPILAIDGGLGSVRPCEASTRFLTFGRFERARLYSCRYSSERVVGLHRLRKNSWWVTVLKGHDFSRADKPSKMCDGFRTYPQISSAGLQAGCRAGLLTRTSLLTTWTPSSTAGSGDQRYFKS